MTAAPKPIVVYTDQVAQTSSSDITKRLRDSFPDRKVIGQSTSDFMRTLTMNAASVCVLPGIIGEKSQYHELLQAHFGMLKMEKFIKDGGILLTACAGSYYICRETEYVPPWGARKTRTNASPLFNAVARGPLAGIAHQVSGPALYEDVSMAPVTYQDLEGVWHKTQMAYGNGPAFLPCDDTGNTRILARYDNIEENPAAVVWQDRGKGAILWLGVLPYLGPQALGPNATDWQKSMMQRLEEHEVARKAFWGSLVKRINKKLEP